jgi:hypothetical protein
MGFERGIIDKMINGAFMGKREIGRPLKYNIRNRGRHGYVVTSFFSYLISFFPYIDGLSFFSTQETKLKNSFQDG